MKLLTIVAASLLSTAPAFAQLPDITAAGDPSVNNDTIYSLAVNASEHPDEAFLYLLDDGVVTIEPDGRSKATYRMVIQVLSPEGAEHWGEHSFGYSAAREKLTINWIKVLRPDGTVISDKPVHEQESSGPVSGDAPVYTDYRVRRVSLAGVEPGTIVDFSFTTETLKPVMPGDFLSPWGVTTGRPTLRSRLIVSTPADYTPRIRERNLPFQRREQVVDGRKVYLWATANVPKPDPEPFAADTLNPFYASVTVAGDVSWHDIGRWYAELARDRYVMTPAIEARMSQAVSGARTLDDSLRAIHRLIAQDLRYVSLSLGMGGYIPRLPAEVIRTAAGDCKDKTTLFVTMARRMGLEAFPVLVSSSGYVDRSLPAVGQFDHMIAAVRRPSGWTFVDLTDPLLPHGEIPFSLEGSFALLVRDDGTSEELTLPASDPKRHAQATVLEGTLDENGVLTGFASVKSSGAHGQELRELFAVPMSAEQRAIMLRTLSSAMFNGEGTVDSLVTFDGKDWSATPEIRYTFNGAKAATRSGESMIFILPMDANDGWRASAREIAAKSPRRAWFDLTSMNGPTTETETVRIRLPAGWRAQLPAPVRVTGVPGTYEATYEQRGDVLEITRTLSGVRGVVPPSETDSITTWLNAVAADEAKFIVLTRSTGAGAP